MERFEIEQWPNYFGKHALMRLLKGYIKVYLFLAILFVVGFSLYFFSKVYLGYAIPYTRLATMVAVYGMILGPIIPIISFLQRNRKHPSYGLNKDGFLLNERGWDAAFFGWDEIKDVKEFDHPKFGKELHFEFVSFTKAINKEGQEKFTQALNREYVSQKNPKKISPELVKGDLTEFIRKFQEYYSRFKKENPISDFEAYEMGTAYFKELSLGYRISSKRFQKLDHIENLQGAFFAFPIESIPEKQLLISINKQEVIGLLYNDQVSYPHEITNNLTKEESIEIIKKYLNDKLDDVKIKHAHFHYAGIHEYPKPCWIVYTKNLKATMEGTINTDYILDAKDKEVVDAITM